MSYDNQIKTDPRWKEVNSVLAEINPAMQADGGGCELVSIDNDGTVFIRMKGACLSCPSDKMSLKFGIEAPLMNRLSWVSKVRRVH